jgi:spore maturation protein CgeB
MAKVGFSPPTRVFEAAGAAACVITDAWFGVDMFFEPGKEILVALGPEDVVRYLHEISAKHAKAMGAAMRSRALREHTYSLRAKQVDQILRRLGQTSSDVAAPILYSAQ